MGSCAGWVEGVRSAEGELGWCAGTEAESSAPLPGLYWGLVGDVRRVVSGGALVVSGRGCGRPDVAGAAGVDVHRERAFVAPRKQVAFCVLRSALRSAIRQCRMGDSGAERVE